MKILITGANGQVAQALQALAPDNYQVTAFSRQKLDITQEQQCHDCINKVKPNIIINTAAYNQVDLAENNTQDAHQVNTLGPKYLAEAAFDHQAKLIHISTDFVFDGTQSHPYSTDSAPNPINAYGKTKYAGEQAVLAVSDTHMIIRTAWVYSLNTKNFMTNMLKLLADKPSLSIVSDQIGTPTSADTLASAIWQAVNLQALSGLFHITDAGVASRYDMVCAIARGARALGMLKRHASIYPIKACDFPLPAKRPAYSVLDKTNSWKSFNITPMHWMDALLRTLKNKAL